MLKFLTRFILVVSLVMAMPATESAAAPASGAALAPLLNANPLIQDVRVFCYNRFSGRFLHWGYCGRRHYYYYYRPRYRYYYRPHYRYYCVNRYTRRFLHWGHC